MLVFNEKDLQNRFKAVDGWYVGMWVRRGRGKGGKDIFLPSSSDMLTGVEIRESVTGFVQRTPDEIRSYYTMKVSGYILLVGDVVGAV